jgi:hypothetical protein
MKTLLFTLAAAIATVLLLTLISEWLWGFRASAYRESLLSSTQPQEPVQEREFDGLPAPVRRYLHKVLGHGQARVAAVEIEQSGYFNTSDSEIEQWRTFEATERVVTSPTAFSWDAAIKLYPGVRIRVSDRYDHLTGSLKASLSGWLPLAKIVGGGEIARGELMRFYAEAPWYPTVLLPGKNVEWQGVDRRSAVLRAKDGEHEIKLLFTFGDDGLVQSILAEDRPRSVNGQMVPTMWEGRWSGYSMQNGLLIPMQGEVAWLLADGIRPYWRGRINSINHSFF